MEFISAEEFLKQPGEMQKVFLDWWKPSLGDLFFTNEYGTDLFLQHTVKGMLMELQGMLGGKEFYTDEKIIPLLTEGQIRQFIEDNTGYRVNIEYYNCCKDKSDIVFRFCIDRKEIKSHMFYDSKNLIECYWKLALEIADEKVQREI